MFSVRVIGPNHKKVVTCAGVANGGEKEWNFVYERYLSTNLANEKDTFLKALSCSKDVKTLNT